MTALRKLSQWVQLSQFTALLLLGAAVGHAYEPGKVYFQASTKEKVLALSFDDGPGGYTPQILDLLKQYGARATFFIEGDQVAGYPQNLRAVRDAGHEIGNHTFYHKDYHKVKDHPRETFVKDVEMTEAEIRRALGDPAFKIRALRMPHGAYGKFNKDWLIPALKEKGYALVHWSFGTDWFLKKSPQQMAEEYLKNAKPGAVLLMHDGGRKREKTLETLKIVLPALKQRGYRIVACEDLFK